MDVSMIIAAVLMIGALIAPSIIVIISCIKLEVTFRKALEGDEEATQIMEIESSVNS